MSGFRLLAKNSAANIAAGMANALLAVALPPLLVRHLPAAEFNAWSVVLQLAAVVNVLQLGVQVGVGRFVAYCRARGDAEYPREIVSTAFAAMWLSTVLALVLLTAMGAFLPRWFPGMPEALQGEARGALWCVGASIALGLPASVAGGVYSGLQRNDVPARVIVVSRIAVAVALFALATRGFGLLPMAIAYATIVGGAALVQIWLLTTRHPEFAFRRAWVTRKAAHELADYCFSLTLWSIGMVAITGLDAVIAGAIDFRWAGYFGIAGSAVALIVGLQAAMLQPLIAIAAHWHSRGDKTRLGVLLLDATRINALVFLGAIMPLFFAGEWLVKLWVGDEMAPQLLPIVRVLLLGIFLRQTLAPFATILLGTGEQRLIVWTPAYEAMAKLAASIGLGLWLGPVGIALGTVVGGAVCVATNAAFNFPRVTSVVIERAHFFRHAIGAPVLLFLPLLALPLFDGFANSSGALALRVAFAALFVIGATAIAVAALRRLRSLV